MVRIKITIIGTETLGVRGLSCFVDCGKHKYLIDPGVALGFTRYGLHPHPIQAAFSEMTKIRLISLWERATDVIITHFHGDHIPLYNANPFQFPLRAIKGLKRVHVWACNPRKGSREVERARRISSMLKTTFVNGHKNYGELELSYPYPHGLNKEEKVMIVKVGNFVHLSDTQLLVKSAIDKACSWSPKVVFTDGPPIYRYRDRDMKRYLIKIAYKNALRLSNCADYVIIDHHISRCNEGVRIIDRLRREVGDRIMTAADYMGKPRLLLESWRKTLYELFKFDKMWFINSHYTGDGEMLSLFKDIIEDIYKIFPRGITLDDYEVKKLLKDLSS